LIVTGLYKGASKPNSAGYFSAIIHSTGLTKEDGSEATYFGCGKLAPKLAANTQVKFDAEQNDRGFWNVKGKLEAVAGTATNVAPTQSAGQVRGNDTNSSIERQVILKAAVEFAIQSGSGLKGVAEAFHAFLPLLQPMAPKAAPKRVEPEDVNQDDSDIPY
jgi:hypothetical protein